LKTRTAQHAKENHHANPARQDCVRFSSRELKQKTPIVEAEGSHSLVRRLGPHRRNGQMFGIEERSKQSQGQKIQAN